MASFLYTVFSMAQVASLHCSVRREISPCTCEPHETNNHTVVVTCEGVGSFNQVFDALQNRMNPEVDIWLRITHSQLEDLETRTFEDMHIRLKNLRLNYNQLRTLPESSFRNLQTLEYLSLASNDLDEIPRHIMKHVPRLGTIDLGAQRIRKISVDDFRMLPHLKHLVMVSNELTLLERDCIPHTIRYLHLGRNNLTSLNGTIRQLDQLEVLFLNNNQLTSLDNELPLGASSKLQMILAHHNSLRNLPQDIKQMERLDSLYFNYNELSSLDGVFRHCRHIHTFYAANNRIEYLATDEFEEGQKIESFDLSSNVIRSVNSSLLGMSSLRSVNLSRNSLVEFSLAEIRGLANLRVVDLSYNHIEKLSGKMENIVEPDSYILELRLEYNRLKTLDGAMMGLNKLRQLSLAHNMLQVISPDDLIGLEDLEILDVSHNHLQTLEETSKSFLPKLETLDASFNNLTKLERDFHGLPVLCLANLTNNRITSISPELVAKTRCNSNTGVVNKLVILLEENPILCQDDFQRLVPIMHVQEARLQGTVHCLHTIEHMPPVPTIILTQPPFPIGHVVSALPSVEQQLTNTVMAQTSSNLVQMIMQPNIMVNLPTTSTLAPAALTTTAPETHPNTEPLPFVPSSPPTETSEVIVVVEMIAPATIASATAPLQSSMVATEPSNNWPSTASTTAMPAEASSLVPFLSEQQQQQQPVDGQRSSVATTTPETDNSVNQSFSPIQVMGPAPDRSQQLLEPDEPPEQINDDQLPI